MVDFKSWIVNTLISDAVLQSYLIGTDGGVNIFPVDIDIQPEQFPCIIYQDSGIAIDSTTRMHIGGFQLDIYSLLNSLQVEEIYDRMAYLLNFKDSTTETITGTLWWVREENVRDMHDSERRMWRKVVTLKFWYSTPTST